MKMNATYDNIINVECQKLNKLPHQTINYGPINNINCFIIISFNDLLNDLLIHINHFINIITWVKIRLT
jgi:hypothetical protein